MFVSETRDFLKYLFEHYSALFLFQRTYCLSDFYECCPERILAYLREVQGVITTIPMRFSVLTSDRLEDAEFAEAEQREFIYNRHDPAHRLVSQGLRDQSALDSLGLQKAKWLEEVHKKFNVLSLINFVFRECLDTEFAPHQQSDGVRDAEGPQSGPTSKHASPSPHLSNSKAGSQALGASGAVSGVSPGPVPSLGPLSLLPPGQLAVLRK